MEVSEAGAPTLQGTTGHYGMSAGQNFCNNFFIFLHITLVPLCNQLTYNIHLTDTTRPLMTEKKHLIVSYLGDR